MITKLYKIAYDLDRSGLYSEAEEIEKMMESLAKRVGLDIKELVSLADQFDSEGKIEAANKIDEIIKEAIKK